MVEGMKIARHIVDQSPMDQFRDMELAPGADCRTDDDWLEFARRDGQTIYHICGTCRMGTDDKADRIARFGLELLAAVDGRTLPPEPTTRRGATAKPSRTAAAATPKSAKATSGRPAARRAPPAG